MKRTKSNRPSFSLDLRRRAKPSVAVGGGAIFADIPRPSSGFDPARGLRFPLDDSVGLLFQNVGKLNDATGAVAVTFSLDSSDAGGILLRTFGSYFVLSTVRYATVRELKLSFYGHNLRLGWPWRPGVAYTARVNWDCKKGFALSVAEVGRTLRQVARNIEWHAYRQQYIPIEIGGTIDDIRPGRTKWVGGFAGWIRDVACYRKPNGAATAPRIKPIPRLKTETQLPPTAKGLRLLELHDPPIIDSPIRFDWIPDRLENYRRCRKVHPELEELYFGAKDSFEGLMRVGRFVSNLWPHTFYWPWPRAIFEERGDKLLTGIKAGDIGGVCGGFAHTMEECLWALGLPARRTQVYAHSSLEVYDHAHDKWICLETDNAAGHAGCWVNADGVPYSIGELIELVERDRVDPGSLVRFIRHLSLGSSCPSGAIHNPSPESWLRSSYVQMGYYKRKDYGETQPPESYWYMTPSLRTAPAEPYTPAKLQHRVNDWRKLYWSCDRVRVEADWKNSATTIRLRLAPFQSQFFRDYQIHLDGVPKTQRGTTFTWRLRSGENRIEIATRNLLGVVGHPWRAVVRT